MIMYYGYKDKLIYDNKKNSTENSCRKIYFFLFVKNARDQIKQPQNKCVI